MILNASIVEMAVTAHASSLVTYLVNHENNACGQL